MLYEIETTYSAEIRTAVVHDRVMPNELARFVPAACGEVWSFIRSAGITQPGRNLAVYLADGSVEAGAEVSEQFTGNGRIHSSRLPAGRVARTIHYGPYGALSEAHAAIRKWCSEQGERCMGDSWEIYGHWEESWNSDPSKIRTDVCYLLEEKVG